MIAVLVLPPLLAGAYFTSVWLLERPLGVDLGNGIDIVYDPDSP